MPDRMEAFIEAVAPEIRWKKARPVLAGGFPLVVSNTNTVLDLFLIGLALSALRNGSLPERAPAPCRKGSVFLRRIRWGNGELILSLRPKQG